MDSKFIEGFDKTAKISPTKSLSFGKSLRGSAFSNPSKPITAPLPKFELPKGNAKTGYKSGGTAGISTNKY